MKTVLKCRVQKYFHAVDTGKRKEVMKLTDRKVKYIARYMKVSESTVKGFGCVRLHEPIPMFRKTKIRRKMTWKKSYISSTADIFHIIGFMRFF